MRTADDARLDPRPGDVLLKLVRDTEIDFRVDTVSGRARKVHGPGHVRVVDIQDQDYWLTFCGTEWRKWAATAEVLKVAQDA